MFAYLDSSKMSCIIHRPDLCNLQTRKNLKRYNSTNRTFINSKTTRSQIEVKYKVSNARSQICLIKNSLFD